MSMTHTRFRLIGNPDAFGVPVSGGDVIHAKAGGALKIGDAVFISAAGKVNKSTTAGNQAKCAGVIVGGISLNPDGNLRVFGESADVGKTACAADGDEVLLQINGFAYVVSDAAISVGANLVLGTNTAGRVLTATAQSASAAATTATQSGSTAVQSGSTVDAGATPVTSTAANGAIITDGAIVVTDGAIVVVDGAITLAGHASASIIGKAWSAAAGAATTILMQLV